MGFFSAPPGRGCVSRIDVQIKVYLSLQPMMGAGGGEGGSPLSGGCSGAQGCRRVENLGPGAHVCVFFPLPFPSVSLFVTNPPFPRQGYFRIFGRVPPPDPPTPSPYLPCSGRTARRFPPTPNHTQTPNLAQHRPFWESPAPGRRGMGGGMVWGGDTAAPLLLPTAMRQHSEVWGRRKNEAKVYL